MIRLVLQVIGACWCLTILALIAALVANTWFGDRQLADPSDDDESPTDRLDFLLWRKELQT